MEAKSEFSKHGAASPRRSAALRIPRPVALAVALMLLIVSSTVALLQKPRPDPYLAEPFPSLRWWLYPIDTFAALGLPSINEQLNAVFALPGTDQVWAVGDAGVILHSPDGGRTWKQQFLTVISESQPALRGNPEGPASRQPTLEPETKVAIAPKLTIAPAEFQFVEDFGRSQASPKIATVTNAGASATKITGVLLTGVDALQFSIERDNCGAAVLEPNAVCTIAIDFQTKTPGKYTATLTVTYVGGPPLGVFLFGTATESKPGEINPPVRRQLSPEQQKLLPQQKEPTPKGSVLDLINPFVTVSAADKPAATTNKATTPFSAARGGSVPRANDNLVWVIFTDSTHGSVVAGDGWEWNTSDGGSKWTLAVRRRPSDTLPSGSFEQNGTRIERAMPNQILPLISAPGLPIKQTCLLPNGHGWAVGQHGIILYTRDGGNMWRYQFQDASRIPVLKINKVRLWPAPWYYLSLVIIGLLVSVAATESEPAPAENVTIADQFASDRPITAADSDPLDFRSLVLGLSRFIRNSHTEPPLTIAVTGEWGTGKSSLMNLLRDDLSEWGFRPVWFNAWHHQKEESLLAALLQNIRLQGVPQWWRPEGWIFRARLVAIRFRRHLVLTLLLFSIVSVATGVFMTIPRSADHAQETNIGHLFKELASLKEKGLPPDLPPQVLFVVSLFGGLIGLWKWMQAFGVKPAELVAVASGKAGLKALEAQTSFRYRFAEEFREVTDALGPRSMIIFIDDLDRCQSDQVVEVLEALNFLMTSGGCFIVLGMARERVERCVGWKFRDIAGELASGEEEGGSHVRKSAGNEAAASSEKAARRDRTEFARQYLDKLINIEVPVPRLTADQTLQLLAHKQIHARSQAQTALRWRPWAARVGRLLPFAIASLILASGIFIGRDIGSDQIPVQIPPSATGAASSASPEPAVTSSSVPTTLRGQPAILTPPLPVSREILYFLLLPSFIIFGMVAYWVLTRPPGLIVEDSRDFAEAIEIWAPLIFAKQTTPRAVKRFLNRLRYVASRQQIPRASYPMWMSLLWLLRLAAKRDLDMISHESRLPNVPEAALVALAALQQFDEHWISSAEFIRTPDSVKDALRSSLGDEWLSRYDPVGKHLQAFPEWSLVISNRMAFLGLAAGVRMGIS